MRLSFIARRNLKRHLSNTIRNTFVVSISAIILMLLFGLIGGMEKDLKHTITYFLSGEIRIQNKLYAENEIFNPSYFLVPNIESIISILEQDKDIGNISLKLHIPVAFVQNNKFEAIQLTGIDFAREQRYNNIQKYIVEGRLPKTGTRELLLGNTTAKTFNIQVGDLVTFTGSTALRGSNGMSAKVVGIIKYPASMLNKRKAIISLDVAQYFFRSPNASTEIAFRQTPHSRVSLEKLAKRTQTNLTTQLKHNSDMLELQTWNQIDTFVQMLQIARVIYLFVGFVFCLLSSLVVYNTIYMAMYTRKYEFGIMNAMGFSNAMLRKIIKHEVFYTVFLGSVLGILVGTILVSLLGHYGLDLNTLEKGIDDSTLLSNVIYPTISIVWITMLLLYNIIICYVVGILPLRILKKETVLSLLKSN